MHTDESFGEQLGARLREEVAEVRAAPNLVKTLQRRRARRTWAIWGVVTTPIVAATAVLALLTTTGHPALQHANGALVGPGASAGQPTSQDPRLMSVAYVSTRTINALSQASRYIIYAKVAYDTGYYETWTDKATPRYRIDSYSDLSQTQVGPPGVAPAPPDQIQTGPMHATQSNCVTGPPGNQTIVTVDYEYQWWSTGHLTDKPSASVVPDITDPDSMRKAVKDGDVKLIGEETVDGLDTLHLRFFAVQRGYQIDMWVDVKTFLPVRDSSTVLTGNQKASGSPVLTTTYAWLPRTAENLAHFDLTPPPGFKRLP